MPNTVIQLKKSATPSSKPSDLANGELAINFADGKLFYKNTAGFIAEISSSAGGGNSFGTVNANGTLVVSDTSGDVLTLVAGSGVSIVGDAINDTVTISSTASGGGGAYYQGNNGDVGSVSGLGDIFRVHTNVLSANVTIYSGNNAIAAGPLTVQSGKQLVIQANARVVIS